MKRNIFITMLTISCLLFACSETGFAYYGLDSLFWASYNNCINRGDYDTAISMYPIEAKAYWYRGRSEIWHSQWDAAIKDMNYCIKRNYLLTDTWFYLGRGYTGKFAANPADTGLGNHAVNCFTDTIKRDSNYGNAYFFRAQAYAQLGQTANACADYRKFLTLSNDNTNDTLKQYARDQLDLLNNISTY